MRNLILILLIPIILQGQGSTSFSGNIDMYSMFRTSNTSLIRLPYRLVNFHVQHQNGDIELNANLAIEHRLRKDTGFLTDSSPQDFALDLRELYLSWFTNFGEIRLGKQIHSWGMVDENSPLDNINAYDYYYLFFGGSDRKIGSYSITMDYYYNDWKFGALFSPIHSTNRFPLNESEFPIQFPILPEESQIMKISENLIEFGGYIQRSFTKGDFKLSYFNGYDRLFNFSGVNLFVSDYDQGGPTALNSVYLDIVYGFRKSEQLGIGSVLFLGDLTFRGDIIAVSTSDLNKSVLRENPTTDIAYQFYNTLAYQFEDDTTKVLFTFPIQEKADYIQQTYQFEYNFDEDLTLIGQYIYYDLYLYQFTDHNFPEVVDIPNIEINTDDINPKNLFMSGMGSPLALLSNKIILLNLEKRLLNEKLIINFISLIDADGLTMSISNFNSKYVNFDYPNKIKWLGRLIELNVEYKLTEGFNCIGAISNIMGDENHQLGDNYPFNQMEDFSHFRLELKYFF